MQVRDEFRVHLLNPEGIEVAKELAVIFTSALNRIESLVGTDGREMSLVRTKLEEASFFAKKSMAVRPRFQQT